VPKSNITIILGDLNTQIWKEAIDSEVTGKHTTHDETNRNGEMLCDFAIANNLIMSIQFQHKYIHEGTWMSPDQLIINQIDHVMINRHKKKVTEDVRSMRGPNIDSNHFLLRVSIKQKLL
jgi:endonuclease/exonuclease/phosphatase family metal-dependent hydrolase